METLSQAAVLADDCILTHKNIGSHRLQLPYQLNSQAAPFHPNPSLEGQNQPRGNPPGNFRFCPRPNQGLRNTSFTRARLFRLAWYMTCFGLLKVSM